MNKYIKLEDAEKLLTNALRIAQGFDEPLERSLVDLPTIEVSEDCISREWLVNRFKDIVEHYEMRIKRAKRYGKKTTYDTSEQIGYWKDEIADCKYFIKEIENATRVVPSRAEGEWIPCSERLPHAEYGESDNVLVTCESKCIRLLYFNGGNWCYPTGEYYGHRIDKVVAWMPLPEPWKGVSDEH